MNIREINTFTKPRDEMNMHLGDALHNIEQALSANQGLREELLRDAAEIVEFVQKSEGGSEL